MPTSQVDYYERSSSFTALDHHRRRNEALYMLSTVMLTRKPSLKVAPTTLETFFLL